MLMEHAQSNRKELMREPFTILRAGSEESADTRSMMGRLKAFQGSVSVLLVCLEKGEWEATGSIEDASSMVQACLTWARETMTCSLCPVSAGLCIVQLQMEAIEQQSLVLVM